MYFVILLLNPSNFLCNFALFSSMRFIFSAKFLLLSSSSNIVLFDSSLMLSRSRYLCLPYRYSSSNILLRMTIDSNLNGANTFLSKARNSFEVFLYSRFIFGFSNSFFALSSFCSAALYRSCSSCWPNANTASSYFFSAFSYSSS